MKCNHRCAQDARETIEKNVILDMGKMLKKQPNEM